jgi:hypothetical protein
MRDVPVSHHDDVMTSTTGPARPSAARSCLVSGGPRPAPAASPAAAVPVLPARQPVPKLGIGLIAAAAFGTEMAVSGRYGYVRDELYFLAAGHHLAFGYVDQPALTPLLARLASAVTGNTLVGLRVLPALALAALIVLTAAMSRMLGAGRTGQLLAALAAATCGEYLGAMHELTTTTPDFVFWAITLLLVMRLLASENPRWWLAIGCCAGVASEAKWNIGFLLAGLAAGFLVTPARRLLRSRYLLLGGVIAAGLAAPDLIWQAVHGWPAVDVFRSLQGQASHNRLVYWPAQVLYTGPVLTPVWIGGLVWSLRSQAASRFRAVAIACAAVIAVQFVLGGKPYYPGAAFTFLLAAGSVPLERWLAARKLRAHRALPGPHRVSLRPNRILPHLHRISPGSHRISPGSYRISPGSYRISPAAAMAAAMLAGAAVAAPVTLSVLPARALHTVPLQKINYDLGETIAWPKLAGLVAREYRALPAAQRQRTTILTGNYGEAGALERYGPQLGLPPAFSGANNFWLWGPPPRQDGNAITVNFDPAFLRREFRHVRLLATFRNGLGVADDEQGARLYLASGLREPWSRAWAAFRDYS